MGRVRLLLASCRVARLDGRSTLFSRDIGDMLLLDIRTRQLYSTLFDKIAPEVKMSAMFENPHHDSNFDSTH